MSHHLRRLIRDLRAYVALLASGADISEINTVRKHLERCKGGGPARLAYPAKRGKPDTFRCHRGPGGRDCLRSDRSRCDHLRRPMQVLKRYRVPEEVHQYIFRRLQRGMMGEIEDTPKPEAAVFK